MSIDQIERENIEALLPWHAAGTLSRRDAQRVEAALAADRTLAQQFELIREELAEAIHLNESLGAPSVRAMQRLMRAIDAEPAPVRKRRFSFSLVGWRLSQFSPRTLAWSATIGALAIVLQAGLLADMVLNEQPALGTFKVQGVDRDQRTRSMGGAYALVGFAPQASVDEITKFLKSHQVSLVEGPRSGDLYKVRISVAGLPKEDLARILKQLQDDNKVVRFVAPTE
jgi:hypothetical protein